MKCFNTRILPLRVHSTPVYPGHNSDCNEDVAQVPDNGTKDYDLELLGPFISAYIKQAELI